MRLDSLLGYFRGQAVTIPPMDGALRPNTALDDSAAELLEAVAPDNLAAAGEHVFFSTGSDLLRLPAYGEGAPAAVARFDASVSAVACSPDGAIAIALDDGRIVLKGGAADEKTLDPAACGGLACPTALAFEDAGTLLVCQGSSAQRPSDWVVDLMSKNASGSVWRVDLAARRASRLAGDLAFPYGVLANPPGGGVVVAESWRHRLIRIRPEGGAVEPVLTKLPGYPARLAAGADGGAWLCLFAPRNRLIEFVLEEDVYRADMMREIERAHWIAPALSSGAGFLEPLQCGGVKTMGIHKPWSPSRSYGLLVRLDRNLRPVASFHSRANGRRHGITSVAERDGRVLVTSKGGNAILGLAVAP
jgi:Strictosidine synthase